MATPAMASVTAAVSSDVSITWDMPLRTITPLRAGAHSAGPFQEADSCTPTTPRRPRTPLRAGPALPHLQADASDIEALAAASRPVGRDQRDRADALAPVVARGHEEIGRAHV